MIIALMVFRERIIINPESGDLIEGAGGLRELRLAGNGVGKSGGYRVMIYATQR